MEQNAAARRERLIGLDEYLAQKCACEIRDLLEEEVFDGYDGSVSVRVRGPASLEALALWQDGACEVGGLMRCSADCLIDGEEVPAECFLLVSCAVTATGVDCELRVTHESPRALMHLRGREKLDRYLLPRAGTRGVEKICDGILRRFCKEKLLENEAVPPEALAKALGLQLVRLPLRGRESVSSLLVTEDTRLLLSCPGPDGKTFRDVPSGTIVLNSAYRSMKNAESYSIAHECYHYAGQRLFRRFQQIAAAEYPRLKKRAGSDAYEDKARSSSNGRRTSARSFCATPAASQGKKRRLRSKDARLPPATRAKSIPSRSVRSRKGAAFSPRRSARCSGTKTTRARGALSTT